MNLWCWIGICLSLYLPIYLCRQMAILIEKQVFVYMLGWYTHMYFLALSAQRSQRQWFSSINSIPWVQILFLNIIFQQKGPGLLGDMVDRSVASKYLLKTSPMSGEFRTWLVSSQKTLFPHLPCRSSKASDIIYTHQLQPGKTST